MRSFSRKNMVWLKGGAIFCYFLLFSATFCYSGHLDFLARLKEVLFCATFCYFLLFWGRQPHQNTFFFGRRNVSFFDVHIFFEMLFFFFLDSFEPHSLIDAIHCEVCPQIFF